MRCKGFVSFDGFSSGQSLWHSLSTSFTFLCKNSSFVLQLSNNFWSQASCLYWLGSNTTSFSLMNKKKKIKMEVEKHYVSSSILLELQQQV